MRGWITLSWLLLPAVMAGGGLLLRRATLGDPTAFQLTWIRAFHAHGAVLILLSIVYYMSLDRTALSASVKRAACLALFAGIAGVTGGFLIHALVGAPQQASMGTVTTLSGAVLLAGALLVLVYGLMANPAAVQHRRSS
jgi:drug/metabolite transporter superfamily protein YnfA